MLTKLSAEHQKLVLNAFYDELEKTAQWSILARSAAKLFPALSRVAGKGTRIGATRVGGMLRGSANVYKKKGGQAALSYLGRFKNPTYMTRDLTKLKGVSKIRVPKHIQAGGAHSWNVGRGISSSIGGSAQVLSTLTKGLKGKGVLKGTAQMGKNIGSVATRQLHGARFKEVDLLIKGKGGKMVQNPLVTLNKKGVPQGVRGAGLFNKKLFNRKILGQTNRGTVVVKKRAPVSAMAMSFTGPGIALATYGFDTKTPSGKEKSRSRRLTSALGQGALWGFSTPVGIASSFLTGAKG